MKKLIRFVSMIILLMPCFALATAKKFTVSADSLSELKKGKTNIHSSFDDLLKKYVSAKGVVNYSGFLKDKTKLQAYLTSLQSITLAKLGKNEQLAFWINAYNAATLDQILRNFPVKSIKDIADGKVWDKILPYKLAGQALSLNDIENQKLLQAFNDARIHFAINCAAKSCPKLSNSAFTADNVEQLLNVNTMAFLNDARQNIITQDEVALSQLFNWFKKDFVKTSGTVIAFVNKFSKEKITDKQGIEFLAYNWDLNGK